MSEMTTADAPAAGGTPAPPDALPALTSRRNRATRWFRRGGVEPPESEASKIRPRVGRYSRRRSRMESGARAEAMALVQRQRVKDGLPECSDVAGLAWRKASRSTWLLAAVTGF